MLGTGNRGDNVKVLIIDDDPQVAHVTGLYLQHHGKAEFQICTDPNLLATVLDEYRPEVVMLDLHIPGYDSLALTRRLQEARPDLPVVVYTGWCDAATRQDCLNAGAQDVMTKPLRNVDVSNLTRLASA